MTLSLISQLGTGSVDLNPEMQPQDSLRTRFIQTACCPERGFYSDLLSKNQAIVLRETCATESHMWW